MPRLPNASVLDDRLSKSFYHGESDHFTDEQWDEVVFKAKQPFSWTPDEKQDLLFKAEQNVRGHKIEFNVLCNKSEDLESFEIRLTSDRLASMRVALFKSLGIDDIDYSALPRMAIDVECSSFPAIPQLSDLQAEQLLEALRSAEEEELAVLALAQECCIRLRSTPKYHLLIRRFLISLCDDYAQKKVEKDQADFFQKYACALLLRLGNDCPTEWAAWHRATIMVSDYFEPKTFQQEQRMLWNAVLALAFRNSDERLDCLDLGGFVETEMVYLCRWGMAGFFRRKLSTSAAHAKPSSSPRKTAQPANDEAEQIVPYTDEWQDDELVLFASFETPEEALVCSVCWCRFSTHNLPVTFGDGRSVCRSCVPKKRSQLSQFERIAELQKVPNYNLDDEPTPLSETFGSTPDLTLGRVVELAEPIISQFAEYKKSLDAKGLGNIYYRQGKYEQAVLAYTQAIEAWDELVANYANRSAALGKLGRLAEARQDAVRALRLTYGRWGKAHYRMFMSSSAMTLSRGSRVRLRVKSRQQPSLEAEEAEEKEPIMDEEEYLRSWKRRGMDLAPHEAWLKNPEEAVVAVASVLRALVQGEKAEYQYRKNIFSFLLADAARFDGITHDNPTNEVLHERIQQLRKTSLVLSLARELVTCRRLSAIVADQEGSPRLVRRKQERELVRTLAASKTDFECTLCYSLLYQPTTLPCGHSFCRSCAVRALDHSAAQGEAKCPMCRTSMKAFLETLNDLAFQRSERFEILDIGLQHVQVNRALDGLLRMVFPEENTARMETSQQEEEAVVDSSNSGDPNVIDIPWLPYESPLMPGIPATLVLWEPAERLMMRRLAFAKSKHASLEENSLTMGKFGVCWEDNEDAVCKHGVLMMIDNFSSTSDGGLMVWCKGEQRFEILSEASRDGYKTARVKLMEPSIHDHALPQERVSKWIAEHHPSRETLQSAIERAQASAWRDCPYELLEHALDEYWKVVQTKNLDWMNTLQGNVCCRSTLPYCIALVLRFPDPTVQYLMFGLETRSSFYERVRFVLIAGSPDGRSWTASNGDNRLNEIIAAFPGMENATGML